MAPGAGVEMVSAARERAITSAEDEQQDRRMDYDYNNEAQYLKQRKAAVNGAREELDFDVEIPSNEPMRRRECVGVPIYIDPS
jgi:hypothetical protein